VTDVFLLTQAIEEVIDQMKSANQQLILINKINFPAEMKLQGKKKIFTQFFYELLCKAELSYQETVSNKIILLTSKFETDQKLSISITDGGHLNKPYSLRDVNLNDRLASVIIALKNEFSGKLEIISRNSKGKTIKCLLPLNQ